MAFAPIHIAARARDVVELRRLLAGGVSPNAIDDSANTPLHYLCRSTYSNNFAVDDRVACFKLLIDAGANLEAVDRNGYTPLHYAANFANVETVSLLVEAGANVNVAEANGWTALHFAAYRDDRGDTDCVELLLAAGADINVRSVAGSTPLSNALVQDHRRMFALFLRAGAEIPTNNTDPYIVRVRNAGGWKKYEQQHLARITAILAPTPRLPPEMVRKIVEFWLHAGYY